MEFIFVTLKTHPYFTKVCSLPKSKGQCAWRLDLQITKEATFVFCYSSLTEDGQQKPQTFLGFIFGPFRYFSNFLRFYKLWAPIIYRIFSHFKLIGFVLRLTKNLWLIYDCILLVWNLFSHSAAFHRSRFHASIDSYQMRKY